jgi:hypothetical protein
MTWQPIETAPGDFFPACIIRALPRKPGSQMIAPPLSGPPEFFVGYRSDDDWMVPMHDGTRLKALDQDDWTPTHWMPLPEAPHD